MALVLDASALLAWWLVEPGTEVVEAAVANEGAVLSSVNLAEVLAKLDDRRPGSSSMLPGASARLPGQVAASPAGEVIAPGSVTLESFTVADTVMSARMRRKR